jgi:hypothetical protein
MYLAWEVASRFAGTAVGVAAAAVAFLVSGTLLQWTEYRHR